MTCEWYKVKGSRRKAQGSRGPREENRIPGRQNQITKRENSKSKRLDHARNVVPVTHIPEGIFVKFGLPLANGPLTTTPNWLQSNKK